MSIINAIKIDQNETNEPIEYDQQKNRNKKEKNNNKKKQKKENNKEIIE